MEIDIKELLEEKISSYNFEEVCKLEIRRIIREEVQPVIKKIIDNKIQKIFDEEIKKTLDGQVKVDDGWGNKKDFPSFMELFKTTFLKQINDSWEMKKLIKKQIESRVDQLFRGEIQKILEKITGELSKVN